MQTINNLKQVNKMVNLPVFSVKVGQNKHIFGSNREFNKDLLDVILKNYIVVIELEKKEIRKKLGYRCSFQVTPDRITKAYQEITKGKSIIHIENTLYF